jgi:hypothetical protein
MLRVTRAAASATDLLVPPVGIGHTICVAQFMVVLDATIVNVALPSIQRGLRFSPSR